VPSNEVWRVLAPLGQACIKQGDNWVVWFTKPRPPEIDDWTHYLYDATGICVGRDTVAGPRSACNGWAVRNSPGIMIACPALTRGSAPTEGSFTSLTKAPATRFCDLEARHFMPGWFQRDGALAPPHFHLASAAVVPEERAYPTDPPLGGGRECRLCHPRLLRCRDRPGRRERATLRTYEQTASTEEIICSEGVLFLLVNPNPKIWPYWEPTYPNSRTIAWPWDDHPRVIMAVDATTGSTLWQMTTNVVPTSLSADASGYTSTTAVTSLR